MAVNVLAWHAVSLGLAACWTLFAMVSSSAAQGPNVRSNGAGDEIPASYRYHLRNDNNLAIRASRLDTQGAEIAVRAKVVIARDGQVFATVRTDEWGAAQVIGLPPAVYSVLTAGPEGFAAFTVRALPFEPTQPSKPAEGPAVAAPPVASAERDASAVQIHLVPHRDYALLKTMIQHRESYVLLLVRDGDVLGSIKPRENGNYSLSGVATGCYSILGGGVTRGVRTFYASRLYHVAAAKEAKPSPRRGAQLLPDRSSAHIALCAAADADDDRDRDKEFSPVPISDYPLLETLINEFTGPMAPLTPPLAEGAAAGAAGAAGGAAGGLGGLLGAAGMGLGLGGMGGGGGGIGGGGSGPPASRFLPQKQWGQTEKQWGQTGIRD